MMDKQIDISKVKSPEIRKRLEICEMENHINSGFDIAYKMQTSNFPNSIAETLYDAGYRKIPENTVVLTKEEYTKLCDKVRQKFEHEYKDKVVLTREEYINKLTEYHGVSEIKDLVCKETAEKFAEKLRHKYVYDYDDELFIGDVLSVIDKICKEITEVE